MKSPFMCFCFKKYFNVAAFAPKSHFPYAKQLNRLQQLKENQNSTPENNEDKILFLSLSILNVIS